MNDQKMRRLVELSEEFGEPLDPRYPTHMMEVQLERLEYMASVRMDRRHEDFLMRNARVSDKRDPMTGDLIRTMRVTIYGESKKEVVAGECPADWWQALKQRFAPKWFLELFPVEFYRFHVSLGITYPELTPKLPNEPHRITMAVMRPEVFRRNEF